MIKFSLKQAALAAALAGMSVGAYAQTQEDLGRIDFSSPAAFNSVVAPTTTGFSDIFTFTVAEPNLGVSASVVDIPLSVSGFTFDTALATMSLVYAGADNTIGGGDDTVLQSVVLPSPGNSEDNLNLTWETPIVSGMHYLNVTGVTGGTEGGIYAGAIAAVPEPETYAMLLAGLGLMGAVVRRRGMRKTS
ncbi:FxDxF family PEP-CTERM protein [Nitrosovibrio sp. Nv6]|uniref:FxDxF family PEP-CTERM protein n=1 Tax=Nitrosovibrio sp. Nv6 TaxID=1855340 RepID=UPI0008B69C85|nr:FxDxF family PEP-CTERM protein [Nitrosovibrio sp. Nv6]SEP35797.1 PEP-CTERM protein-sorting domain-containing protein [Nitrosovibrio sp. Nv6]